MKAALRQVAPALFSLSLVAAIGLPVSTHAAPRDHKQSPPGKPAATWSRTFTTYSNYPASVIATSDGGYLVTGSKSANAKDTGSSLWVMKTDKQGGKLWEFAPNQGGGNHGYAAIETADGYLVTGTRDLSARHEGYAWSELSLIKLARNGSPLWEQAYRCQWSADSAAGEGRSLLETDDGGLLVAGYGSVAGATNAWLLRLDRNGNRQWEKFLGAADNASSLSPVLLANSHDGHFYSAFTTPEVQGVVLKQDAAGNILWRRQIDQYPRVELAAIRGTNDGGVLLSGSGDHDGLLMKIAPNGSPVWHRTYGKTQQDRSAKLATVTETPDHGLLATGAIAAGAPQALWLLRTDDRGNPIRDQELPDPRLARLSHAIHTPDGGHAGIAHDAQGKAIRLFKLDAAGRLGK